jgi:hypothetical protein
MANISTDFSTWSGTAASNQPDSGDTATVQADLQAIQAALRTIFPSVNAAVTPTHTELNYVDGVTSAIQTQLDAKATLAGGTFTGDITMNAASIITAEGAAVTAASSTNIWATDGNTRHITGNTTINDFGTAPQAGARMKLIFDGTPTLTQGANLNLNGGGSNITIAADDWAEVYADTTTQFDVVVHRKSGASVVSGGAASTTTSGIVELATTAEMQTGTDTTRAVTVESVRLGAIVQTAVVTLSSTTTTITSSIPTWAKVIFIQVSGMSTSGTSIPILRLGVGGTAESTNYLGGGSTGTSVTNGSTGAALGGTHVATYVKHGGITLSKMEGSNTWAIYGNINHSDAVQFSTTGYTKALAGVLDSIFFTTVNGTDTFDGGTVSVSYL